MTHRPIAQLAGLTLLGLIMIFDTGCGADSATPGSYTMPPLPPIVAASGGATATPGAAAATYTTGAAAATPPAPALGGLAPLVPAAQEHLSTFGMDVDTGSYTAARAYLQGGQLPPPSTVRVEEFVNYFHYEYPAPKGETFGINLDSAPAPFGPDGTQLVRVGIQGRSIDAGQRQDAVLTFVIDVSGSMGAANRLPLVKEALRALVGALHPRDQVAIVVFSDQARVILDHTAAAQRETILAAIDSVQIGGATYMEDGLRLGYALAGRHLVSGAINRVILCSDGEANVGATGPDPLLQIIGNYSVQGVLLTTVGFGLVDTNNEMLRRLADHANGSYAYVDSLPAAKRLFVANLTGTLQIIARDAKIQVDFNPAVVQGYRLLGYEKRALESSDFRNDKVDAGEVGAGQSVTALYEVALLPRAEGPALTVQVRYADPQTGKVRELRQPFNRSDFGRDLLAATPRFRLAAAVAGFAAQLRGDAARPHSLAEVQALAHEVAPQLANDADVQEFAHLVATAAALQP